MRWCRGDIRRQIEFFDPSVTIAPRALTNPPFRDLSCPKSVTHVSLLICHPCPPTIPSPYERQGGHYDEVCYLIHLRLCHLHVGMAVPKATASRSTIGQTAIGQWDYHQVLGTGKRSAVSVCAWRDFRSPLLRAPA